MPGPTRADPFLSPAAASAWAAMGAAAAQRPFSAGTPLSATYPSAYRGAFGAGAGAGGAGKPGLDAPGLSPRGLGVGVAPGRQQAALLQSSLLGLSAALAGGAAGQLDPQAR